MTISIRADHRSKKILFDIGMINETHKKAIKNALYETGKHLAKETVKNIETGIKSGRTYTIRGSLHQASAAGQAPADLTGTLKRSVDYITRGAKHVEFGYKANYGKFLENGTKYMKERPNLATVSDKETSFLIRSLKSHFKSGSKS